MEYIGKNTNKPIEFPAEYPLFEVGHNVLIKPTENDEGTFYTITNRSRVIEIEKQDNTNWLVASGSEYNANNLDEYLKATKDTLYILTMGVMSNRNVEIEVRIPNSTSLYGIYKEPNAYVTPRNSPPSSPSIVFYTFDQDETYIPNFTITNPTEYTPRYLKLKFYGYKYAVEELDTVPTRYHTIVLNTLGGGE